MYVHVSTLVVLFIASKSYVHVKKKKHKKKKTFVGQLKIVIQIRPAETIVYTNQDFFVCQQEIAILTILFLFTTIKCYLGLQFLNPNKAAEMAQILEDIQSKYVLTVTSNGGETEVVQKVIFDGDQLTEEWARNCQ